MRRLATLALLSPLLAAATAVQDWMPRQTAELQTMDKVTARVSVLQAPVGQPVRFGTLTIIVRACNVRPSNEVANAAAWMEVTDSRAQANAPLAFHGWMFSNTPGVSMLEHPVYDIRVLSCR